MEYKTIIEVISEAGDSFEAADVAGEYLCGHIDTGVQIKCKTLPLKKLKFSKIIFIILVFLGLIGFASLKLNSNPSNFSSTSSIKSAIQPPLKTHIFEQDFRKKWDEKTR